MDAAAMAAQSDPDRNFHFRRRWGEGPPLKRERPPLTGISEGAKFEEISSSQGHSTTTRRLQWASSLDRQADAELALGHVAAAERLAHFAAEIREAGR